MSVAINPQCYTYLAVDLGGGSGRVMAGTVDDSTAEVTLTEIHRFANKPAHVLGHTYWNIPALYEEIVEGIRMAVAQGITPSGIAVDTWGVDFGLIDQSGELLALPMNYRDSHTVGCAEEFMHHEMTPAEFYAEAGLQVLDIDTVFRLRRLTRSHGHLFAAAKHLLFTPDLISYMLTGEATVEYTIASTSGLLDPRTRTWNSAMLQRIGLDERLLPPIVMPGIIRGYLTPELCKRVGLAEDAKVPVMAVGSHDTASAVHSVKQTYAEHRAAYLSSGTWSLLGVVVSDPVLTEQARLAEFTNEGAADGSIRFLTNITGLWILQQLMAQWSKQGYETDYVTLLSEAESARTDALIDVDDSSFHNPHSMSEAIADYCRAHGIELPQTRGEYVRCVLQSLARRYARAVDSLNSLLPHPLKRLIIIGGGSRNDLLNRLTAEATGLEVIAGEAEATAIGNILMQHHTINPRH